MRITAEIISFMSRIFCFSTYPFLAFLMFSRWERDEEKVYDIPLGDLNQHPLTSQLPLIPTLKVVAKEVQILL